LAQPILSGPRVWEIQLADDRDLVASAALYQRAERRPQPEVVEDGRTDAGP
jgi:hypothetical protein